MFEIENQTQKQNKTKLQAMHTKFNVDFGAHVITYCNNYLGHISLWMQG